MFFINIGMLVSSGFSVYLIDPDKINGPSKVNSHVAYCMLPCVVKPFYLATRDTGVPNLIQFHLLESQWYSYFDSYLV